MSGRHRAGSFYFIILAVMVTKIKNTKVWIIEVFEGGLRIKSSNWMLLMDERNTDVS